MANSPTGFDVLVTETSGTIVLRLSGSIDRSNHEALTHICSAAMACGGETVEIDCSELAYFDSALLDTIDSLRESSRSRRVVVQNLTPFAQRLFDICEVPLSDWSSPRRRGPLARV